MDRRRIQHRPVFTSEAGERLFGRRADVDRWHDHDERLGLGGDRDAHVEQRPPGVILDDHRRLGRAHDDRRAAVGPGADRFRDRGIRTRRGQAGRDQGGDDLRHSVLPAAWRRSTARTSSLPKSAEETRAPLCNKTAAQAP